jgi:predicted ribosome quality control (RQC) complex YloA/Tae2 family protein
VSNALQYDPLLAHYLADELDQRLRGRGCAAAPHFDADRSVTLIFSDGEELRVDLHPTRGWVRVLPHETTPDLELDAVCTGVSASPDERIVRIELEAGGRFRSARRALVLELHTNQWNALLVDAEERVLSVLRARRAGARVLQAGSSYVPPPGRPRFGATRVPEPEARSRWEAEITAATPEDRRARLIAEFAWTGSINADWILEPSAGPAPSTEPAFRRWWWLRGLPARNPTLLRVGPRVQPYPLALAGWESEPAATLLDAMSTAAEAVPSSDVRSRLEPAERLARARVAAAERRIGNLERQLVTAGEADRLRSRGDLILAHLHLLRRGEASVVLAGWDGEPVEIPLDPLLTGAENAAQYYDRARRKTRAEEQVPKLLETAREERRRWLGVLESVAAGVVPEWVSEALGRQAERPQPRGSRPAESVPYRLFRTSGGLEVRVGRGSRENDRLTFRESSPNDVWLHARSVPGSHVILRWPDAEAAPPARDLAEAAQLAAVFSRARTSATVPVDWTRRKYVRKPRGAAPGLVIPQRVKTLFVEPDEAVVERLAVRD